jgi:hypothetical protein
MHRPVICSTLWASESAAPGRCGRGRDLAGSVMATTGPWALGCCDRF